MLRVPSCSSLREDALISYLVYGGFPGGQSYAPHAQEHSRATSLLYRASDNEPAGLCPRLSLTYDVYDCI